MPQYDYTCENCQHNWEVTQKMNDPKITECPECKELKAKRLISKTSFQLNNNGRVGWGNTGYGSNK